MTEAEAIEAIAQHWLEEWPTLRPLVPFVFENEAQTFARGDTWARVAIVPIVRYQSTAGSEGNRKFTMRNQIVVQLFGPVDRGVRGLFELADDVRKVFEAQRISQEIVTYAGSTRPSPGDGRWAMVVVTTPYWVDETR